ncbi:hypothetical protein NQ023_12045 [Corynebacterium phoceense]|nr:hypothetical protein [Corynebacterium phoceense]
MFVPRRAHHALATVGALARAVGMVVTGPATATADEQFPELYSSLAQRENSVWQAGAEGRLGLDV